MPMDLEQRATVDELRSEHTTRVGLVAGDVLVRDLRLDRIPGETERVEQFFELHKR